LNLISILLDTALFLNFTQKNVDQKTLSFVFMHSVILQSW